MPCHQSIGRPPTHTAEPQRWQQVDGRHVNVFSAYVDRRVDAGGPMLRIIASGLQEAYNLVGTLYCQIWLADTNASVVISPATYEPIYRSPSYPAALVAHFVRCPFNGSASSTDNAPQLVSVVGRPCGTPSNVLLVLDSDRVCESAKRCRVSFALCLPALHER